MKKIWACLTVIALLYAGIAGGLAVVPHGHGDDLDHSRHASCPIYQASLHAPQATEVAVQTFVVFLVFSFLAALLKSTPFIASFFYFPLRGPPAYFA
jgi:hypothetical protein